MMHKLAGLGFLVVFLAPFVFLCGFDLLVILAGMFVLIVWLVVCFSLLMYALGRAGF